MTKKVLNKTVDDLISARTTKDPVSGCWTWGGALAAKRRPVVWVKSQQFSVIGHLLGITTHSGYRVLHGCERGDQCVNPAHKSLEPLKRTQNVDAARARLELPLPDVNGCQIWEGSTREGEGTPVFYFKNRRYPVPHLVRPGLKNPVPGCGNRLCVSPEHLVEAAPLAVGRETPRYLERLYGLEPNTYEELLREGCHICGSDSYPQIDHDHTTNAVRGVLCSKHNSGIGKLGDGARSLQNAIKYLKRNGIVLLDPLPQTHPYSNPVLYRREKSWIRRTFANQHIVDELYAQQANKCGCCGSVFEQKGGRRANLDHEDLPDGAKRVRGVLCLNCNQGIGKLDDNLQGIERALAYLRGELNPRKDSVNGTV